jgi:hypothetical protein
MRIPYEKKVLSKNDQLAAEVRRHLQTRGMFAINLIGSPGSGKTLPRRLSPAIRRRGTTRTASRGPAFPRSRSRRGTSAI